MNRSAVCVLASFSLSLALFAGSAFADPAPEQVVICSWNTEWLFDNYDGDNYAELAKKMTAPSRADWDWKLSGVEKVVREIKPTILALQEIENQRVLFYLNQRFKQDADLKYRIAFIEGSDYFTEQDVGLLALSGLTGFGRREMSKEEFADKRHMSVTKHVFATFEWGSGADREKVTLVNMHLRARGEAANLRIRQANLIRTWVNELITATVANVQGGLVSDSLGIKERRITLAPGEWKVIKSSGRLQDNVMPINYPGPSQASFNLLEFLLAGAKEIASIKDVLTGEGMGKNASPTTTMAMIEQGLQVFTAIYKRIHRSLKAELGIHARLNRKNLDPQRYNQFFDDPQQQFDPKVDYNEQDCDILPVSDPNNVSKMQKLAKAQFIEQTIAADETGVLNKQEGYKRLFEAAGIEDVEKLFNPPQQPSPEEQNLTKRAAYATVEGAEAEVAVKKANAALAASQSMMPEAQIEELVARLMMDNAAAQQPQEPAAPTLDPNVAQADAMQQHNDQMALERDKLASSHILGAAKIQQAADAAKAAAAKAPAAQK